MFEFVSGGLFSVCGRYACFFMNLCEQEHSARANDIFGFDLKSMQNWLPGAALGKMLYSLLFFYNFYKFFYIFFLSDKLVLLNEKKFSTDKNVIQRHYFRHWCEVNNLQNKKDGCRSSSL